MRGFIIGLFAAAFMPFCLAYSQEDSSAFKQEGYVRELMNPDAQQLGENQNNENQPVPAGQNQKVPGEKLEWSNPNQPEVVPQQITRLTEEKAGVRIRRIGAILSSANSRNVERDVKMLTTVANQHNFSIGDVYFMVRGFQLALFSRETIEPLKQRGGDAHIRLSLPYEYRNVKSTPAWIISTEKGDVILEGTEDPLSFINSHGEFVEPGPAEKTEPQQAQGNAGTDAAIPVSSSAAEPLKPGAL